MGQFEELLCKKLKKYDDVIIYGFEDIGMTMLDYIIDIETSIKIANYSGRVKYFATSVKERKSKRTEKKGIRIKSIYDLTDYAKSALVIIATQEQHHSDIRKILNELGFDNQLYILHENYCEIRKAIEEHKLMVDTNIQNYHINHYNKLNRLREKIKNGEKAKVFFMTHDAAVFGAMSVYRAMEKCDVFEPYIYIVSRRDVGYAEFMEDVKKDVDFFENYGCRVICGYDAEGNPKDIHPQYIRFMAKNRHLAPAALEKLHSEEEENENYHVVISQIEIYSRGEKSNGVISVGTDIEITAKYETDLPVEDVTLGFSL